MQKAEETSLMALFNCFKNGKEIKAISWISFFWSSASLMVFAVLPVFLSEELGISHTQIGMIEGLAISSSFITKVFSGILSDYFRKRKPFILLGSFLSMLSKPMFALASSLSFILLARFMDRMSKGVRSAPTDAFIADISLQHEYSKSFSLRQSLYTLGAVFGAMCSMIVLYFNKNDLRLIFWLSIIPNILAILIFFIFLGKSKEVFFPAKKTYSLNIKDFKKLPPFFWKFLGVLSFLMVARFSEAFLTLYAKEFGCPHTLLPLIIIIMDLFHAGIAAYSGRLTDIYEPKKILLFGLFLLVFNNIWFYTSDTLVEVFIGFALVGIHMGLTQGLIKSVLAENIPKDLRGTSFALFYLVTGVCIFFGNILAGSLSDRFGIKFIFLSGGIFSFLAFVLLAFLLLKNSPLKKKTRNKGLESLSTS